jgi:preprotein translocase subunit SecD
MQKNLRWKLILIVLFMGICIFYFVSPKEQGEPYLSRMNLGLDLKGGIHLVLQVVTDDAINRELLQDAERISHELKSRDLHFDDSRKGIGYTLEVTGIDAAQDSLVRSYLDGMMGGQYSLRRTVVEDSVNFTLTMSPSYIRRTREETVQQALETVRRRVDALGVVEPTLQIYGGRGQEVKDQIIVELPGVDDPERVKELIESTAQLELCLVKSENGGPFSSIESAIQANAGRIPDAYEIFPYVDDRGTARQIEYIVVNRTPVITGREIKTARTSTDEMGAPAVNFFLTSDGAVRFTRATEQNVGERLAIVLDKRVTSAPVIRDRIGAEGIITGNFTSQQASDLAMLLRSGALPASLNILHDQTVGASLGIDSIRSGIMASIIGFGMVVIIMVLYYKFSGFNAIWCLLGNLIILLGFMGAVGATLTLPGIAGIILIIGMAVDSNILIFERIREELRAGKSVRAAVDTGFSKVFWTLLDTHVSTLIAAAFLFQFGTGPVRGFAVTLTVGLIANMFTAVYVSHRLFEMRMGSRRVESLSI